MSQESRPQPNHVNTFPTSDAGPYSSDQWAGMFRVLFTADQQVAQGPLIRYANELEPTESPANTININTGAGICNGHFFHNDASVIFTPAAPAGNPRIDVVCMVENNTAIVRSAGIATANTLIFPTDLTDYNATSSIEPYSCRLAILPGNEAGAPVAPTLDVDVATLYMVPLYQYEISVGGVVTANLDRRTFARFATDEAMVLIETKVHDNSVNNYSFSSIPQQFNHLRIVAGMKSNLAANDTLAVLTFNGDVAGNYDFQTVFADGAAITTAQTNAAGGITVGRVAAFALGAAVGSTLTIDIPNYKNTTFNKSLHASMEHVLAVTASGGTKTFGVWQSTAAINAINIGQTGNIAIGVVWSLYGLR